MKESLGHQRCRHWLRLLWVDIPMSSHCCWTIRRMYISRAEWVDWTKWQFLNWTLWQYGYDVTCLLSYMYCYAQCYIMHRIQYRIYHAFLCTVVRACEGIVCLMYPGLPVCAGVCLYWWQCWCGAAIDDSWQHEEQAKWSVLLCACVLWLSLICVTHHVSCLDWFSTCCVVCFA